MKRPNALSLPRLGNRKLVPLQPQSSHRPVALLLSGWAQVWNKGVLVIADSLAQPYMCHVATTKSSHGTQ